MLMPPTWRDWRIAPRGRKEISSDDMVATVLFCCRQGSTVLAVRLDGQDDDSM